jgi:hypothetical protein
VQAAAEFVLLAYPDLMQRPVTMAFNVTGRTVGVMVNDAPAPGESAAIVREPLLTAAFRFTASGELETYAATGVLVDRVRNEALVKTLAEHPDWTETDADAALQAMGGRPSTGAAPASPVDAFTLERFIGRDAAPVEAARLRWRPSKAGVASEGFAAVPGWTTEVTAKRRDGQPVSYRLVFEPFAGRLVMVTPQ